ncbi:hypothetical protein WG66_017084 [Moniliophthora roreri]|nr:hypothetical protein WG66_017084 [Moniliophthora roreri]
MENLCRFDRDGRSEGCICGARKDDLHCWEAEYRAIHSSPQRSYNGNLDSWPDIVAAWDVM